MKRGKIFAIAMIVAAFTGGTAISAPKAATKTPAAKSAPVKAKEPAVKQKAAKEDTKKKVDTFKLGFKDSKAGKKADISAMDWNLQMAYQCGAEFFAKNGKKAKLPTDSVILELLADYEKEHTARPIQREGAAPKEEILLDDPRVYPPEEELEYFPTDDMWAHPQPEDVGGAEEEILGDGYPQHVEEEILGDDLPQFNR